MRLHMLRRSRREREHGTTNGSDADADPHHRCGHDKVPVPGHHRRGPILLRLHALDRSGWEHSAPDGADAEQQRRRIRMRTACRERWSRWPSPARQRRGNPRATSHRARARSSATRHGSPPAHTASATETKSRKERRGVLREQGGAASGDGRASTKDRGIFASLEKY
jgi:hypothetical protein